MGQSCKRISGHCEYLLDCAKHILNYGALSSPPVEAILSNVGVELDNDSISASFNAAVSTPFSLYVRRCDGLLDNPIVLIVPQQICSDDWATYAGYSYSRLVASVSGDVIRHPLEGRRLLAILECPDTVLNRLR